MVRRLDYHIHTKFCRHAVGEMEEYVEAAIAKGLDEMGFSDHFIMIYLPPSLVQDDYCMKEAELPLYIEKVKELQRDYAEIEIKLGIEADYYEGKAPEIQRLLKPFKFDYIYGSTHVVRDIVIDDERFKHTWDKYSVDEVYEIYFRNMKNAIQSGLFDIMAHLDVVKKYGDRPTNPVDDLIAEVIDALVQNKVCVEFSTGGFRKPVKEQYPSLQILRALHENDVAVTIGSDSHRPDEVGWELDKALQMLRDVGFSQIVGFKKRKRIYYDL